LELHRANTCGGGRVEFFETEMRDAAIACLELEASLRRSITQFEISPALKPVVRPHNDTPLHAEALVSWHFGGCIVEPYEFIRVAGLLELDPL
jgi:predicted signal transduction protein with EAL and GGDEF domain